MSFLACYFNFIFLVREQDHGNPLLLRWKKSDSKKETINGKGLYMRIMREGWFRLSFPKLKVSLVPALVFLHEFRAHTFFFSYPSLCKNAILWPDMKVRFFHDESPTVEEVRTSSKQASIFRMPLNIVQKPAAKPWCNEQNEMWVLVFSLHYDRISSEVTPVHVPLSSIQTRLLFQSVTYMNNKYFTFHF